MFTIPSPDPKRPLKCNILWVISEGCVLDIEQFYAVLSEMRDDMPIHPVKVEEKDRMPDEPEFKDNNKHKYTEIRRALLQLQKEGWPINKPILPLCFFLFFSIYRFLDFLLYGLSVI